MTQIDQVWSQIYNIWGSVSLMETAMASDTPNIPGTRVGVQKEARGVKMIK